jgi:hypothetical protein
MLSTTDYAISRQVYSMTELVMLLHELNALDTKMLPSIFVSVCGGKV